MIYVDLVHPFFRRARLKCNENAVFSFKNTQNKEKGPFLFEKWSFVMLVVALIF